MEKKQQPFPNQISDRIPEVQTITVVRSANAAREVGKLKSEVSRLQARLVGSVSRVEHVKAIKEREDVIASMVSAEEVPPFTLKPLPTRPL